jgi:hypothetical protein
VAPMAPMASMAPMGPVAPFLASTAAMPMPMSVQQPFLLPYYSTVTSNSWFSNVSTDMITHFIESYLFLCIVMTLVILLILWKKNPVFIQKEADDPMIQQRPSFFKLVFIGCLVFFIFLLGPCLFSKNSLSLI